MGNDIELNYGYKEETTREQNGIILRKTLSYRGGKILYGILVAVSEEPLTSVKVLINKNEVVYRPDDPNHALRFTADALVFSIALSAKELGEGKVTYNFRAENSIGKSAGMGGGSYISE